MAAVSKPKSIAVLMTCHNRREKTVACVASLQAAAAAIADDYSIAIYLVDDGSTDGTAEAVAAMAPEAHVLSGSGDLFWNGGMRMAFEAASLVRHDFHFWLNDDVVLDEASLSLMLETFAAKARHGAEPIVVGAMRDEAGQTTYSGLRRMRPSRRTNFTRLKTTTESIACETFNGNCVLIPASAVERLGNLDSGFMHAMADLDYGLRATAAGIPIWLAPGHAGTCGHDHQVAGSWKDRTLPLMQRWRKLSSRKVLAPSEWALFCRRHTGAAWPLFWAWPYVDLVRTTVAARLRGQRAP